MWWKSEKTWQGVILRLPLLLLSIFLATDLFAKERDRDMSIVLVAVGEVDRNVIEALKNDLNKVFNRQVLIGKAMPEPHYAFNKKRNQYLSTTILSAVMEQKDDTASLLSKLDRVCAQLG